MKILSIFTIVAIAIFFWHHTGSADRLYQWIDTKGITHLSKEPPPESGKSVDIMEFSVRTNIPEKTAQDQSGIAPEKQKEQINSEKLQKTEAQPKPKIDLAKACYIQAGRQDVYVYVIEFTSPDRVLEKLLYKGTIPKGRKQLIRSSTSEIVFSYQRSSDSRSYGDNKAKCVDGRVISLP